MKEITKVEFDQLQFKQYGTQNDITVKITALKVGEGLIIMKDEWKINTKPNSYIGAYAHRYHFKLKTRTLKDGSGWAILRIK